MASSSSLVGDRCDAVDLDVEMTRPGRHVDEDPRRRVLRKVSCIDRIDDREFLDRGAVDVALENVIQRRSGDFETQFHLLEHDLGLALDWSIDDLAGRRIEWRKPG